MAASAQVVGAERLYNTEIEYSGVSVREFPDRASRIWLYHAIFWLTFVDLLGLTMATELVVPDLMGGLPFMLFSRIRPLHVNGVIFAWLSMMYWGGIFFVLPRLVGTKGLWSETLGYWMAWAFSGMFIAGVATVMLGYTQGREYWEFIWPIDVWLLLVWLANCFNVIMTVLIRTVRPLYVTVWWFLASPLWLAADYFIANVMWKPGRILGNSTFDGPRIGDQLSGAFSLPINDAMLNWWGSHNLFGLWLTPMLVALTYYFVPRITGTPLYSHTLSLISFWGIAFFYTGVGHHHLLQAPIPGWAKTFATANSIMLLVPVFAFVVNITLTMRMNWEKFATNIPLRFVLTGFIFYFLVNVQGSFQAVPQFNRVIHFTNFIVAHSHLALLGGFTILGQGVIDYAITHIHKKPPYSRRMLEWQYWLVTIGFLGFFTVLTIAGFIQGQGWLTGQPEVNLLPSIRPYYIARGAFGAMIVMSGIVQMIHIYLTVNKDTRRGTRDEIRPFIRSGSPARSEAY